MNKSWSTASLTYPVFARWSWGQSIIIGKYKNLRAIEGSAIFEIRTGLFKPVNRRCKVLFPVN